MSHFIIEENGYKIELNGIDGIITVNANGTVTTHKFVDSLNDSDSFVIMSEEVMMIIVRSLKKIDWKGNPDILFLHRIYGLIDFYRACIKIVTKLQYTKHKNRKASLKRSTYNNLFRSFIAVLNCCMCALTGFEIPRNPAENNKSAYIAESG